MMITRTATKAAAAGGILSRQLPRHCSNIRFFSSLKSSIHTPPAIRIVEVGPRDGLQNEATLVTAAQKCHLIQLLHRAGLDHIEAGSFVSSKRVPSMADSLEVMQLLNEWRESIIIVKDDKNDRQQKPSLTLSCLVPNTKGLDLAIQAKADEIAIFASASEGFSQRNLQCSIQESMERFQTVVDQIASTAIPQNSNNNKNNIRIRGYVSCVIACPYDGVIDPAQVAKITMQLLEMGCHQVSLGDTIGVGTPASVLSMLQDVQAAVGTSDDDDDALAVHFHDTYGQGLANILVSLERDIRTIDASVAGLGGCPYAKGATGNVATEDVVYMLNGLGVETGVDIEKLVDAGEYICSIINRESRSRAGKAIASRRHG
jgi:hydroxymethylglutaryl-CoA lyase